MSQPVSSIPHRVMEPAGAEVDLDLSTPLGDADQEELRALFAAQHLLVFRGQHLSFDDQVRVMGHLGPVNRTPGQPAARDYVSKDPAYGANFGTVGLSWHSDLAHCPEPMLGISLHALDVTDGETSTLYVDGARTLTKLPADLRARLGGLHALQCYGIERDGQYRTFGAEPSPRRDELPHHSHPVVTTHPKTGEQVLYVLQMMTDHIEELPLAESDTLLAELFEHLYADDNVYEHWWNVGDLVIWDNIAVQHARRDQAQVGPRTMQRVVIAEKSLYDQYPNMTWKDGHAALAAY
jgi:taurine dioxygenase